MLDDVIFLKHKMSADVNALFEQCNSSPITHDDFREQKMLSRGHSNLVNTATAIETTSDISASQVRHTSKWSSRNQLQLGRLGVDKDFSKFHQDINIHTNGELIIVYLVFFVLFEYRLFTNTSSPLS